MSIAPQHFLLFVCPHTAIYGLKRAVVVRAGAQIASKVHCCPLKSVCFTCVLKHLVLFHMCSQTSTDV
jgi:hypothetical protein